LLIIQNWTFFSSTAWLPKRPILGRNRNLKGSPCLLSIYALDEIGGGRHKYNATGPSQGLKIRGSEIVVLWWA
jgi:hypothetical protein